MLVGTYVFLAYIYNIYNCTNKMDQGPIKKLGFAQNHNRFPPHPPLQIGENIYFCDMFYFSYFSLFVILSSFPLFPFLLGQKNLGGQQPPLPPPPNTLLRRIAENADIQPIFSQKCVRNPCRNVRTKCPTSKLQNRT